MTLKIIFKNCSNMYSGTFSWFGFFIGLSITDTCVCHGRVGIFACLHKHKGECQSNRCIYLKISKYQEHKASLSLTAFTVHTGLMWSIFVWLEILLSLSHKQRNSMRKDF